MQAEEDLNIWTQQVYQLQAKLNPSTSQLVLGSLPQPPLSSSQFVISYVYSAKHCLHFVCCHQGTIFFWGGMMLLGKLCFRTN